MPSQHRVRSVGSAGYVRTYFKVGASEELLRWKERVAAIRVLLVEDEGLIRMMTAEFLQDEGFVVTEARDGDEAAGLLDGLRAFDVLFTDVRMPGVLDGVDLAMHARRLYASIPLLVVSGYAAQLTTRLGVLDPAAVFIGKPYEMREMSAALKRLTVES